MLDTIRAEAERHARTGGMPTDNPYGKYSEYRDAWDHGFMQGMLYVRNELKVTQKAFYKAVDAKLALEAQLAQVKAEYDAFLLEQGY
jgi:hypothetical protein